MHMLLGLGIIILAAFGLGRILLWAHHQSLKAVRDDNNDLVEAIHELLPHTQCAQCGQPGCKPYAQAVAAGEDHRLCPPGGALLQNQLDELLNRPKTQNLSLVELTPKVALIRENECIGCVKCLEACPVDAIVGAAQMMHTVIADECTGCELCIAPCPVDCIDLVEAR